MVGPVNSSGGNQNVVGGHISPSGFDYNRIQGVQGSPHVTPAFIASTSAMKAGVAYLAVAGTASMRW